MKDQNIKVINYGTSGQTWDSGDLRGMFRGSKESTRKIKMGFILMESIE